MLDCAYLEDNGQSAVDHSACKRLQHRQDGQTDSCVWMSRGRANVSAVRNLVGRLEGSARMQGRAKKVTYGRREGMLEMREDCDCQCYSSPLKAIE